MAERSGEANMDINSYAKEKWTSASRLRFGRTWLCIQMLLVGLLSAGKQWTKSHQNKDRKKTVQRHWRRLHRMSWALYNICLWWGNVASGNSTTTDVGPFRMWFFTTTQLRTASQLKIFQGSFVLEDNQSVTWKIL